MVSQLIPSHALVGLITFGTTVQIHELGYQECSKAYVFRGSKEVTAQQVQEMLGLARAATPQQTAAGQQQAPPSSRFMQTVAECDYALTR